jgi:chemotaxis-related protein WspB
MLLMLFNIGDDRFAIDARELVEVVPSVPLQTVYGMPLGVVGLLGYQAGVVPVIDLGLLTTGQPCTLRLSTRILVVHYRPGPVGARIGLRVDRANDTVRVDPEDFIATGLTAPEPPCFGRVLRRGQHTVQLVEIEQLLSEGVRQSLFTEAQPT